MSDVTDALRPADMTGLSPDSESGVSPSLSQMNPPLIDEAGIARVIDRLAHQILERDAKSDIPYVLLGIPSRGVPLAHRLAERIEAFAGVRPPVGALDITLYRDDLRLHRVRALDKTVEPSGGITARTVILVDDVLYSGRTIRAALDAVKDVGRPAAVRLAVLVDRGHRELPIKADYVGKNLPTAETQSVRVRLREVDDAEGVWLDEGRSA